MMRSLATALVIAGVLGACKAQRSEPNGLGSYRFGHTTLATLNNNPNMTSPMSHCQPTELADGRKATWCFALNPIKVGERTADVDAYFLGSEPPLLTEGATEEQKKARLAELSKLPLIEVQLKIRGCVETQVEQWMRQRYGGALPESKGTKVFWLNSFMWAMAELPSEPGRCVVHMLPRGETSEIERLKSK
jgi:hypothetical protein